MHGDAKDEARVWQKNYPEYKRLADNEIIPDLDEALSETNDGSLSASLFKLPKRIVNSNLVGRVRATDRDDAWITELANIYWEKKIIPNANTQAPFHRKWKDAVRKAAIYGHVPLITLFVERGKYVGGDFVVGQPGDVLLEAGKVSDYDSDLFFWDVFYSKLKLMSLIERAEKENKEGIEGNTWNIKELKRLLEEFPEEEDDDEKKQDDKPRQKGVKFTIVYQRGVDAPFYMIHTSSKTTVREWTNPDPSGDVPIHFLYCYQDMENPYGIGICKLAGGTQNVLDYFRQADVLATQIGIRPPVSVRGTDLKGFDPDSIVYAQDALWYEGNAQVERREISNQVYSQLPNRISMYQTSLQKMIPMGDTSISSSSSGDPNFSKTPAGVKFQQASLSIDDEDFKDNLYMTYEAKTRSIINTTFANMEGHDLMKLSDEDRDLLVKAGIPFPIDPDTGEPITNELDIAWDEARAEFEFEIDAEQDKAKDDEKRLEGLLKVAQFRASDPMFDQKLLNSGKRLNDGELFASIIQLTTDNDKILEDVASEDSVSGAEMGGMSTQTVEGEVIPPQAQPAPQDDLIAQIMQQYGVEEWVARAMAEAEASGFSRDEILQAAQRNMGAINV